MGNETRRDYQAATTHRGPVMGFVIFIYCPSPALEDYVVVDAWYAQDALILAIHCLHECGGLSMKMPSMRSALLFLKNKSASCFPYSKTS